MNTQLVVFDMAGTTVEDNQNVAGALQNALASFRCNVSIEDVNKVMGYPKPVAIRNLLQQYAGAKAASDNSLVEAIHDCFVQEIIDFYEHNDDIREKAGAKEVFCRLRERGIKVALDTGFSREIADTIIERLGWQRGEHYDVCITSDEVANGRPYPDTIYRAMELLNIRSTEAVAKVGDTVSDLQEGNAAGCRYVIGIITGAYKKEELIHEKHTHLVSQLSEIPDIVMEAQELACSSQLN